MIIALAILGSGNIGEARKNPAPNKPVHGKCLLGA